MSTKKRSKSKSKKPKRRKHLKAVTRLKRAERRRAATHHKQVARYRASKKAVATRQRKTLTKKQRRSLAAKKGWRTRALNKRVKEGLAKKLRKPRAKKTAVAPVPKLEYFERMGSLYLKVAYFPMEWVVRLIDNMRKVGVRHFRFIRKVPASPKYPSGIASTNWRADVAHMTIGQLEGYLGSMFIPGVDVIEQVVIPADQLPPDVLPE